MLHRRPARLPNQTPHRVPQQVHVRRVVHVRFHHERVTPPAQWLSRLFSCDLVAALHHQLSHRRQQIRRQQRHVVSNRLALVIRLVAEVAVSQERPHLPVMVRKVVKTVEVAAQALLEDPQHEDRPQGHPRTPHRMVHLRLNMLLQQREQPRPKRLVRPDVLKPLQHRRDVVPRLGVEPDLLDWHLAEPELSSVHVSHGGRCREDLAGRRPTARDHGQEYDIPTIFAT